MNITNKRKRKVLIITYYFPPLGMGGVQRVSKFVKYLPSFGWEPVVLTVKDIEYFSHDDSLLQELPSEVKIIRTGSLDPLRIIFLFKKLFYRNKSREKQTSDPKRVALRNSKKKKAKYFPSSLLKFIEFFYFPDNKIDWLPFVLIKGIRLCRKEKIHLIFSTSPPLTCHLAGFLLKKITRIKWVSDYRDSYSGPENRKSMPFPKKYLLKYLQKIFSKNADALIGVNQMITVEIEDFYARTPKAELISNGYDQKDFEIEVEKEQSIFRIIYFGTFSPDCPPEPFLIAFHNLLQQNKIDKKKIKFIHSGFSIGIDVERLIEKYDLKETIESKGYLPHKEGVKELLKSDLALLTVADSAPVITTGKIFEYLGAQIPILAIVPQAGEAGRIIESLNAGKVVSPENIAGIEEAILYFYREFESWKPFLKADPEKLKKFDRKYLTLKLAQLFDAAVKE
jgi:glycosyltransferase involved in cell wall biosynthesis